jgi:hypothetical protein
MRFMATAAGRTISGRKTSGEIVRALHIPQIYGTHDSLIWRAAMRFQKYLKISIKTKKKFEKTSETMEGFFLFLQHP